MATSPSHRLGEFIGAFFEKAMISPIKSLSSKYNIYFDTIGPRPARPGKKVTWADVHGSRHDLDYVLERGGTDDKIGVPIAFIELAWRRYTKHSKNKAQEISGAVMPIAERFKEDNPFKGAILCGEFTAPSLAQLRAQGFAVLYIPFEKMVNSFAKFGLDIFYDEGTPEDELAQKYIECENFKNLDALANCIIEDNKDAIQAFMSDLERTIGRALKSINILPLHGKSIEVDNVDEAINYVTNYKEMPEDASFQLFIVIIKYNDGSQVNCEFKTAELAISFFNKLKGGD